MKLSIIVCVSNERKTIKKILKKINQLRLVSPWKKEIIIVDNCSIDGTREILSKIKRNDTRIIFQKINIGKGHSVKTALKFCTGQYVIPQDSDLEYDPSDIRKILNFALRNKHDLVVGSRIKKGKRFHKYWINEIGANFLTIVFNSLFKTNFSDVASCYKLMNLKKLKRFKLNCNGFDLDYEMCAKFTKIKASSGEIKIKYSSRSYHEGRNTKIFFDGFKALFVIISERFFKK